VTGGLVSTSVMAAADHRASLTSPWPRSVFTARTGIDRSGVPTANNIYNAMFCAEGSVVGTRIVGRHDKRELLIGSGGVLFDGSGLTRNSRNSRIIRVTHNR